MPTIGAATTIVVHAYDTATGLGKTGDAANITLHLVADGTGGTIAGSISEVDSTNQPGVYKVTVASGENTGVQMSADGKSATSGIVVVGYQWTNSAIFGTDGKALISTDAQDVSGTLSVNAKKLNGATPNNLAGTDVLDAPMSGHTGSGTAGGALNAAGSAGDPWATDIPGAYGAGTAGNFLGNLHNAPDLTVPVARLLGLSGSNQLIVPTLDGSGRMVSGVMYLFDSAAHTATALAGLPTTPTTGLLYQYAIAVTYTGTNTEPTTYEMTLVS
jgi:hypothetical protein